MATQLPQNNAVAPPNPGGGLLAAATPNLPADFPHTAPGAAPAATAPVTPPPTVPTSYAPPPQTMNPQAPAQLPSTGGLDPAVLKVMRAIRHVESQGNYSAVGDNGSSMGAYQWNNGNQPIQPGQTPLNWQAAAKQFLGDPAAPMTPANQNFVAYHQILAYKNKGLVPNEIDALWNGAHYNEATGKYQHINPARLTAFQSALGSASSDVPGTEDTAAATPEGLPTYGATFPASHEDNGLVAGFKALGNLPSSVYGLGAGLVSAVTHPIATVENLGRGVVGGVENLTGQNPNAPDQNQEVANQIGHALIQRYGSLEAAQNAATNDPFGVGSDIAAILTGGAAALSKVGIDATGALGRTVETVGGSVTGRVSKAGTKFATVVAAPDTEAIAAAQRTRVTLPAGSMTTNPIIQRVEAFATLGEGSRNYERIYQAAVDQMNAKAADVVASTGGAADLSSAGEKIAAGFQQVSTAYKKATGALYDSLQKSVGDVVAQTNPALSALDGIIAEKQAIGDTANLKFFQEKRNVLLGAKGYDTPTFSTLRKLKTNVGQMIDAKFQDPFVKTNIVQLKKFYGSIESSIAATAKSTGNDAIMQLYKDANASYVKNIQVMKSQYARTIQRLAEKQQYDKLAEELVKPSTPIEDIPRILAAVGEEGTANIRSGLVSKVFQASRNAEGDFTQRGILMQIKKFATADGRNRLAEVLTPEQFQGLQDLGKVSDALGNVTKIMSGSQTTYLFRVAAEAGAIGAGIWSIATGDFLSGAERIGSVIGYEGFSYFITSPRGQRFLKAVIGRAGQMQQTGAAAGLTKPLDNGSIEGNDGLPKTNGENPPGGNPSSGGVPPVGVDTGGADGAALRVPDNAPKQPEELAKAATTYQATWESKVANIADRVGLDYETGPAKDAARIAEKMQENGARDLNRSVFLVPNLDEAYVEVGKIAKAAAQEFGSVSRIKFDVGAPGYNKILINVPTDVGEGEIQISTPQAWETKTKGGAETLYNLGRAPTTAPKVKAALQQRMNELYTQDPNGALKKAMEAINSGGVTMDAIRNIDYAGTPHISVAPFPERTHILTGPANEQSIAKYLADNFDLFDKEDYVIGGWHNKEDNQTYLDVALPVPKTQQAAALDLAKKANQIAVFDLETFDEIATGGDGTTAGVAPLADRQAAITKLLAKKVKP